MLALAVGLRALLLPVFGPPAPYYPDEFSMLLQADTFALGRLANPTHPLFVFFETVYVAHLPSYSSMYFPGRGAPLALGQVLFGHPWAGAWLSMVLLALGTLWMLRAWVSSGMALLGSIIFVVRHGVLGGWLNSYYGGGLIALGGVLVMGAFPRLMNAPRWRDGVALGAGLAILMISRPFEGLLFSLPFLAIVGWRLLGTLRRRAFASALRLAGPTVALTGAGAILMLAYNTAASGDPLVDPYTHNRLSYAYTPAFLFADPIEPTKVVPAQLDTYYRSEGFNNGLGRDFSGFVWLTVEKVQGVLRFYMGPALLLPFLIGLVLAWRRPILLLSLATIGTGFLTVTFNYTQYLAPATGVFMLLIMMGLSWMRDWRWRERPSGLALARLLPVIVMVLLSVPYLALLAGAPRPLPEPFMRPCCSVLDQTARTQIIDQLEASPGRHLVLYRADLDDPRFYRTMVANAADIDGADIVWAHDLGAANRRLFAYYPDRKIWVVEGFDAPRAVPLDVAAAARPERR